METPRSRTRHHSRIGRRNLNQSTGESSMTSSTLVEAAVSSPDPLNSSSSSDQGCSTTPPAALLPPRPIVLSSTPCTESEFAYSPRGYDEDDEDGLPPCSQMEIRRRRENGEVYWEDEGSPATKAKLQERLAAAEALSPSLPPKKLGPYVPHGLIKLVQKKKPDSATLKKREESKRQQVYLSIKKIADTIISNQNQPSQMDAESGSGEDTEEEDIFKEPSRIQNSRKKKLETATKDCLKNSNGSSEDVFGGSDDDSFLISASQAIEKLPEQESPARKMSKARQNTANSSSYSNMRSESKKRTPCAKKKLEIVSDPFDDGDDSFDLLMSQIDEKVINKAKPSSSATKLVKAPTPKFSNRNTTHSVNSKSSGEFKRFHSADDNKDNSRYVPRSNSSPDVPVIRQGLPGGRQTGSSSSSQIKPKCSQADIERKRLEALKRRRNHSGKGKL